MSINLRKKYRKKDGEKHFVTYYVDVYERSKPRKHISLSTKSKRRARQKFAELERKYDLGTWDPWNDQIKSSKAARPALKEYIREGKKEGYADKTIKERRTKIGALLDHLPPGLTTSEIRARHLEAFLDSRDLKKSTQQNYYNLFRAFFKWCKEKGYTKTNPTADMTRPKPPKKVPRFLSRGELDKLISAIEADYEIKRSDGIIAPTDIIWLKDVILFAVYTGMRLNEICSVKWEDVDEESGYVFVRGETKTNAERAVPLVPQLLPILETMEERCPERKGKVMRNGREKPISYYHTSDKFRKYRDVAKLPKAITFHTLRHTYASWLRQQGVDLQVVKEALGHEDLRSTMIYAHITPGHVRDQVTAAFDDL